MPVQNKLSLKVAMELLEIFPQNIFLFLYLHMNYNLSKYIYYVIII